MAGKQLIPPSHSAENCSPAVSWFVFPDSRITPTIVYSVTLRIWYQWLMRCRCFLMMIVCKGNVFCHDLACNTSLLDEYMLDLSLPDIDRIEQYIFSEIPIQRFGNLV